MIFEKDLVSINLNFTGIEELEIFVIFEDGFEQKLISIMEGNIQYNSNFLMINTHETISMGINSRLKDESFQGKKELRHQKQQSKIK